ncbi:hypothetical protein C9374_005691 [Naegleria lovaniensis]|uniref:Uncharacterized protein n=1 Tax=Naegleria lovaniensis TaxID=51637 RepID=A0AA88GJ30_NAELO|nr:uncharacterized protein C9374_005691 [Naegleria lovaniensis]KAG2381899.1 hypothetical protein C9374_005691 [Naegleria lovaniensis]
MISGDNSSNKQASSGESNEAEPHAMMEDNVESLSDDSYQHPMQRRFVNNPMMRDQDDQILEEDDNCYGGGNDIHPFNMGNIPNNTSFNMGNNNKSGALPNSSSGTGSSSLSQGVPQSAKNAAKKRRRFTPEEDKKIKEGIAKNKKDNNIDWDGVAKYAGIERTKEQIKSRYLRMKKEEPEQASTAQQANSSGSSSSTPQIQQPPTSQHQTITSQTTNQSNTHVAATPTNVSSAQPSPIVYMAPPSQNDNNQPPQHSSTKPHDHSLSVESEELNPSEMIPSTKKQKTLPQMFQQLQTGNTASKKPSTSSSIPPTSSNQNSNSLFGDISNSNSSFAQLFNTNSISSACSNTTPPLNDPNQLVQQHFSKLQNEIEILKDQLRQKEKYIEQIEPKIKNYDNEIGQLKNLLQDYDIKTAERTKRFREIAVQFLRERAERERIEDKKRVNEKTITIGTITYQKGMEVYEVWQDGTLFQQYKETENRISMERDKLEKQKKTIQKQRQQLKKEQISHSSINDPDFARRLEEQMNDLNEQEETIKLRLNHLKKEETQNSAEQEKLFIEKSIQIREIKRIRDQEKSMFKNYPIIGHQKYIPTTPEGPGTPQINGQQPQPSNHHEYFLMKMLGKGGFSEVYKAYDLTDFKVVACKIHQLNPNWKEHRKENYIKHVLRECQINQSINHDKLIKMYDTFVFDNNTFVTVLEYCEGADLDLYIKKHQRVPEREAKNIISQIFSGLNYLSQQKQKVIHYDLKPANILFDKDGNIKITDFGLSKIMDDEESIELTSQGAGTYWYLPPECFHNPSGEGPPPKISNKVDVWSAGVIFYQMLYGTKPFGNNLSQQKILSEGTIVNATQVGFPDKPSVSEEAKDFIRRCLTHDMAKRPDVKTLYNDPYLRGTTSSSTGSSSSKSKKKDKEQSSSSTPTNTTPTNFLSYHQ